MFYFIKVHEADRLSSRICHGCISYLNSWQSFKNRCLAAQKKQRTWLFLMTEKEKLQRQHADAQAAAIAARQKLQQQINRSCMNYNKDKLTQGGNQKHDSQTKKDNDGTGNNNNATSGGDPFQKEPLDLNCVKPEPAEAGMSDEEAGSDVR